MLFVYCVQLRFKVWSSDAIRPHQNHFSSLFELAHAAFWGHTHSIWYKWSLKHTLCQFQALLLTTDYPLRSQHQEMSECDELYRNSRDLWYCLRWVTPEDFGKEYRASWLADAAPVGLVIIHSRLPFCAWNWRIRSCRARPTRSRAKVEGGGQNVCRVCMWNLAHSVHRCKL